MRLYLRHSSKWQNLVRDMNRDQGYKLPDTDKIGRAHV